MNPVVLIATHNRQAITTTNIATLLKQSYVPQIVIVCSDEKELKYYNTLPVICVFAPNNPLGNKWQIGMNHIREYMTASHVIVTGSDDILSAGFIRKFCTGIPFTGLQRWYVLNNRTLYLFDYLAKQCLGGGRVYSRSLLDAYGWQVFDKGRNKLLDDKGWGITNPLTRRIIKDEGCILAVKGEWETLNPFPAHLKSKNVTLVSTWSGYSAKRIVNEKFNYEV